MYCHVNFRFECDLAFHAPFHSPPRQPATQGALPQSAAPTLNTNFFAISISSHLKDHKGQAMYTGEDGESYMSPRISLLAFALFAFAALSRRSGHAPHQRNCRARPTARST